MNTVVLSSVQPWNVKEMPHNGSAHLIIKASEIESVNVGSTASFEQMTVLSVSKN
jgi:hypothetical protein